MGTIWQLLNAKEKPKLVSSDLTTIPALVSIIPIFGVICPPLLATAKYPTSYRPRWICGINPTDLGNVPFGMAGYQSEGCGL